MFAHIQKIDFIKGGAGQDKYFFRIFRDDKVTECTDLIELEEAKSLIALVTKLCAESSSALENLEDGMYHFLNGKFSKIVNKSEPFILVLPDKTDILKSMVQIPYMPIIIRMSELLEFKRSEAYSSGIFTLTMNKSIYNSIKFNSIEEATEAMCVVVEHIHHMINHVNSLQ
jgi:hypothetical protein